MKLSQITLEDTKAYLRVTENDEDNTITTIMEAAKSFILSYTALSEQQADEHAEFSVAFFCLCSDMFDNRQYTVTNDKLNPTVQTILGMHAVNYM